MRYHDTVKFFFALFMVLFVIAVVGSAMFAGS